MAEVLLLLLAYGFLLDWFMRKIGADAARLPWVVRRRALVRLRRQ